jgi:hypothetical protein
MDEDAGEAENRPGATERPGTKKAGDDREDFATRPTSLLV